MYFRSIMNSSMCLTSG